MFKRDNFGRLFMFGMTAVDLALVLAGYAAGWWLRFRTPWLGAWRTPNDLPRAYVLAAPVVLAVFWVVFKFHGLYRLRRGVSPVDGFSSLVRGVLVSLVTLSALAFFDRTFHYSIKVFLAAGALSLGLLLLWRTFAHWLRVRLRRRGYGAARTLVVGSGPLAAKLVAKIRAYPGTGLRLVGLVDDGRGAAGRAARMRLPLLGPIPQLGRVVASHRCDTVLVALPARQHHRTQEILLDLDGTRVDLRVVSDLYGLITKPAAIDEIHGIPVFALREAPLDRLGNRILKRAFDLALVVPGILLLGPVLLAVALAVKLDSPGPVLYTQERVGLGNRVFRMFKFRTMRQGSDKGATWTVKDDPRRTRIGAFLRRTSIDELPQLFNILAGDMSVVGPRPEQPRYVEEFRQRIPRYLQRHQVKAGLTGWAQVHGLRGDTSIDERTAFDLYYVENWNLSLDLLIVLKTALELFEHETAY